MWKASEGKNTTEKSERSARKGNAFDIDEIKNLLLPRKKENIETEKNRDDVGDDDNEEMKTKTVINAVDK